MILIRFGGSGEDSPNGEVLHMNHPIMGGEYTMCGITLDGDEKTAGSFVYETAEAVTCEECAKFVIACRGVAVNRNPHPPRCPPHRAHTGGRMTTPTRKRGRPPGTPNPNAGAKRRKYTLRRGEHYEFDAPGTTTIPAWTVQEMTEKSVSFACDGLVFTITRIDA